jgi:hypothetical protein
LWRSDACGWSGTPADRATAAAAGLTRARRWLRAVLDNAAVERSTIVATFLFASPPLGRDGRAFSVGSAPVQS